MINDVVLRLSMPEPDILKVFQYNMPPTFKEGAKKIITTDKIAELGLKPGHKGVVISLDEWQLCGKIDDYNKAVADFNYWHNQLHYKFGDCCFTELPDLSLVYDYFPYYTTPKGNIQLSGYHSHIRREHFKYIDEMIEKKTDKQLCFDFEFN